MLTLRTLVKHCLPLVNAPKLDSVEAHLRGGTLDTRLLNSRTHRLLIRPQCRLLLVTPGPQGYRRFGRDGCGGRDTWESREVGSIPTDGATYRAGRIDRQGSVARWTERPTHLSKVCFDLLCPGHCSFEWSTASGAEKLILIGA